MIATAKWERRERSTSRATGAQAAAGRRAQIRRGQTRTQAGVMLLEALIAILIFSIGILAMIGMQSAAVKEVGEAKYRADAAFLANQLVGQLWVDRNNLTQYAYPSGGTPPAKLDPWVTSVQTALPGVNSTFSPSTLPKVEVAGTTVTITIYWRPPAATTANRYVSIAYING